MRLTLLNWTAALKAIGIVASKADLIMGHQAQSPGGGPQGRIEGPQGRSEGPQRCQDRGVRRL